MSEAPDAIAMGGHLSRPGRILGRFLFFFFFALQILSFFNGSVSFFFFFFAPFFPLGCGGGGVYRLLIIISVVQARFLGTGFSRYIFPPLCLLSGGDPIVDGGTCKSLIFGLPLFIYFGTQNQRVPHGDWNITAYALVFLRVSSCKSPIASVTNCDC